MPDLTPSADKPASAIPITAAERLQLHAARRFIGSDLERRLGVRIPFDVYFQDPQVAAEIPALAFDEECVVPWEPGLGDGPTSARFAVVDYDGHTETLAAPARWDGKRTVFVDPDGTPLDKENATSLQFHQVNVWALVQRALEFFEGGFGLGRRILWGFEGNRLIIVPHAGFGENAYYDRTSKSLQFYYFFDDKGDRAYTCLSTDIVHHEFGHAVLDGIRPHYMETVLPETAAFHEFMGDLTAILITFRNNAFRKHLIAETGGDLSKESTLSGLAEQFGRHVKDQPYLRSARSTLTMDAVVDDPRPHHMSQVLTAAMFDIIMGLSRFYMRDEGDARDNGSSGVTTRSVPTAFWHTIQRMQNLAIQPLDLLPPVDVTFRDYALAVLRADEVAYPTDPDRIRTLILDAFIGRGILTASDRDEQDRPRHVFERLDLDVFHDVDTIAGSRADAYRFLDDNRKKLFIPPNADVTIAELSTSLKLTRQGRRLPKQVLLQYVWREDVKLEGAQFGRFDGQMTTLLCGGTLALDQNGDVLAWARKPGSVATGDSRKATEEHVRGVARRAAFLEALARRTASGQIGSSIGGEKGLLGKGIPPFTFSVVDGGIRFELTPHFGIHDDVDDVYRGRTWQISS